MADIYIIRHGRTALNKAKVFRGRTDVPLDEVGHAEAEKTARSLADVPLAAVYTSPLVRSVETARLIARRHALQPRTLDELVDIDLGDWTGRPLAELEAAYPELFHVWLERPQDMRFPSGECLGEVALRARAAMIEIAAEHGEAPVAVVSHRVVIKCALCSCLGLHLNSFWNVKVDTGSVSLVRYRNYAFELTFLNDTCHLKPFSEKTLVVDF